MNIDDNFIYIGKKKVWDSETFFGLETKDRRQHLHVIGKTGTGKTTLLRNLIIQDILLGRGIGLIDPHGDLAEEILNHIPGNRVDDVVYFDPSDTEYPIGLNLFTSVDPDSKHLIASGIVSIFKNIWPDYWGPRLEYILYVCAASLLECENTSLLGVIRLLSDETYRTWVVKQIKDPMLRNFWNNEYENYGKNFLTEAIMPVQNKVGQMLMVPFMRNILGQIKSKIDMGFMMDNRRIFIANLSKGKLGDDKAHLLGSILTTKFQMAAMARANVPEEEREDFFLYVDEFQNFTTDSFASLLSEARKYRLNLTLSHQYVSQLKDSIKNAVFGNVGSTISFRVGYCARGLMKGRIAIPLHDMDGKRIGYAGRFVDDSAINEDNPRYLFPPKRERDGVIYEFRKSEFVYNGFQIQKQVHNLIVVEGFASVWWLWEHGYQNVVALMGSSCSERQAELIINLCHEAGRVWLLPDGDDAGERCAETLLRLISPRRLVRWIRLHKDMQPTDLDEVNLEQVLGAGDERDTGEVEYAEK